MKNAGVKGKSKKTVNRSVRKVNKVSKTIKRYVKATIHKEIENKRFTIEVAKTLSAPSNPTNFQSGNIYQLTPSNATNSLYTIPQSLTQGGRTGNKVSLRSAMFRYVMYPTPYNVTSNPDPKPLNIGIYIFSVKRGVLGLTVADAWNIFNGTIFANGSSSNGTVNNLYDLVSPINTDVVQIHYRKVLKLQCSEFYTPNATQVNFNNNDYKYNCMGKINVGKYLPKNIVFNDADNNSTSKQVFMIVCPYFANGTTIPSTTFPCAMFFGMDVQYEDA